MAADARRAELAVVTSYAKNLGLAFQIADDLLDVLATREETGKDSGQDAHKTTFVGLLGVAGAERLCSELLDFAIESLAELGKKAEALRQIAEVVRRRGKCKGDPHYPTLRPEGGGHALLPLSGTRGGRGEDLPSIAMTWNLLERDLTVEKGDPKLEEVRGELQRLGYLDRRMERYLLQDAFRPEAPGRTVLALTSKVAFLIGLPGALRDHLGVAFQGGLFDTSPFDVLPLFLHLLVPAVLLLGGAFLLLALLLVALLKLTHFRRIEASAFALAALAAAATVLALALFGREARASLPDAAALLGLLALPAIGYGVLRTVHDGLLVAGDPPFGGRARAAAGLAAGFGRPLPGRHFRGRACRSSSRCAASRPATLPPCRSPAAAARSC